MQPVHIEEFLRRAAALQPEKCALRDKSGMLSYAEYYARARSAASLILAKTCGAKNAPVFVGVTRSLQPAVLFLAVALSGNFYVPVDPTLPQKRLADMQAVVQPVLCLTADDASALELEGVQTVGYAEACAFPENDAALQAAAKQAKDTDPLCCIFTSGSTGVPKAVCKTHRAYLDMLETFVSTFPLTKDSVFGNQAPFDFDVSAKDVYLALRLGATVTVLERMLFSFPIRLIERLNDWGVNTLIWAVSAMKLPVELEAFEEAKPAHLRLVMFSGEILPPAVLFSWQQAAPTATFVNLYGPTEIAFNCTYHVVDGTETAGEILPIGTPFANMDVFLWQDGAEVTAPLKRGEILIAGSLLALGYCNDPERTNAAFVPDPRGGEGRVYRTGDLASYNARGELVFHGRADTQVKHQGHRVELAEIELAAQEESGLAYVCCLFDAKKDRIWLFYQSETDRKRELAAAIKARLPDYMMPARFVRLDAMPANRTGKIDRLQLRKEFIEA